VVPLALMTVLAALGSTSDAQAKTGYTTTRPMFLLEARLPKSHGYSIGLVAGHRHVEIVAVHGRDEQAIYSVRGRATSSGVHADFGRFGRVDAAWSGKFTPREEGEGECRGKPPLLGRGTLRGTIRFRGEKGFFEVSTSHARAGIYRTFRQVCRKGSEAPLARAAQTRNPPGPTSPPEKAEEEAIFRGDVLEARAKEGTRTVTFTAVHLELGEVLDFGAVAEERVGRVDVTKLSEALKGSLVFSDPDAEPETALAAPGAPFRGTASFRQEPGGTPEWSGDLRVPLPGLGMVQLTGDGMRAAACHPQNFFLLEGCGRLAAPRVAASSGQRLPLPALG
jgi:hypothetical protein